MARFVRWKEIHKINNEHESCLCATYVFVVIKSIENIIRQTAEQINDKPRFQIVHTDDFWVADHLAAGSHKGRMKV